MTEPTNRKISRLSVVVLILSAASELGCEIDNEPEHLNNRTLGPDESRPDVELGTAFGLAPGFKLTHSDVNSSPSQWHPTKVPAEAALGDEKHVFFRELAHTGDHQAWTLKFGKGGQIYSLKMPETGELIAKQRLEAGQWVDEVYQHTFPMKPQKDTTKTSARVDADIHQAGYYRKSDLTGTPIMNNSIYSPMFNYQFYPTRNQVYLMTWPQHAHLPRYGVDTSLPSGETYLADDYKQNFLSLGQTVTDEGNGVIRFDIKVAKWRGTTPQDMMTIPKATFRTSALPVTLLRKQAGLVDVTKPKSDESAGQTLLNDPSIMGWMIHAQRNAPEARGVGIVFGKATTSGQGAFAWWNYNSKYDDLVGTSIFIRRNIPGGFNPYEIIDATYYMILGKVSYIDERAAELVSKIAFTKTAAPSATAFQKVCSGFFGKAERIFARCKEGRKEIMATYSEMAQNTVPLFLLFDTAQKKYHVTSDPYMLSFNPTDLRTDYVDFLGWAAPAASLQASCAITLEQAVSTMRSKPAIHPSLRDYRVKSVKTGC